MQFVDEKNIEIDPELEKLLPPLSKEDYQMLEQSLLKNGFMQYSTRIQLWCPPEEEENDNDAHPAKSYIIDGHNRYRICQKHNIDLPSWCFDWLCFDTKEEVKKYIYENQLARRNLAPIQKISIAEQYRSIYEKKAKENQGARNDLKNNIPQNLGESEKKKAAKDREVNSKLAKVANVNPETYRQAKRVLDSENDDLKQRVLSGETSISAGYKELMMNRNKNTTPIEKKPITPEQKIIEFDNRMNEIDREISSLRTERESLMRRRSSLFESLDIPCELKYEFVEKDKIGLSRDCVFYVELNGHKQIFTTVSVYSDESPLDSWSFIMSKIPEKYKNDFIMLWKKAHYEEVAEFNRRLDEWNKKHKETESTINVENKEFYKKCFRILAKNFHPDNEDGNMEDMQCLNQLKGMWGI